MAKNKHLPIISGPEFKKCRRENGVTLPDLAEELGISRGTVYQFEEEEIDVRRTTLIKFSQWFMEHPA